MIVSAIYKRTVYPSIISNVGPCIVNNLEEFVDFPFSEASSWQICHQITEHINWSNLWLIWRSIDWVKLLNKPRHLIFAVTKAALCADKLFQRIHLSLLYCRGNGWISISCNILCNKFTEHGLIAIHLGDIYLQGWLLYTIISSRWKIIVARFHCCDHIHLFSLFFVMIWMVDLTCIVAPAISWRNWF